jgi:hypothetical protein
LFSQKLVPTEGNFRSRAIGENGGFAVIRNFSQKGLVDDASLVDSDKSSGYTVGIQTNGFGGYMLAAFCQRKNSKGRG